MVNNIAFIRPPMVVSPVQALISEKDLANHSASEQGNDTIFLENPKEIKSSRIYEKGLFIDYYV